MSVTDKSPDPHHGVSLESAMTIPENHLDTLTSPNSFVPERRASRSTQIVAVIIMPLLFMVAFSLAYVSALHAPAPHDMKIAIAGPSSVTSQVVNEAEDRAEGAFSFTQSTDQGAARTAVQEREAAGGIVIEGNDVTTLIASAGGQTAAAAVKTLGTTVANALGGVNTVEDVAAVAKNDATGANLFYFLVVMTVGGYLSITMLAQALPKARLRTQLLISAGAAVLAPILGFASMSLFVGDYGSSFGEIAAVLGIGMLYTLTVTLLATALVRILDQAAIFGVLILIMALNLPSAGGAAAAAVLPPFWQAIHNCWFGAAGMEAMRSIVYFDGAGVGRWVMQLLIWLAATGIVLLLVRLLQKRREQRRTTASGPEADPIPAAERELSPTETVPSGASTPLRNNEQGVHQ